MPRWTQDEYAAFIRKAQSPQSQCTVRHEPVAAAPRENEDAGRIRVCVTRFGRRLLDPDNVCPKYFIDCLRYAGLIPDDRAQDITLEVRQEKVGTKDEEGTLIEVTKP